MKNLKNLKNSHSAPLASGGGALSLASRALRACGVVKFCLPSTFGRGRNFNLSSAKVRNLGEGKTLSRIAKIRSRSLSNFPLAKQYSIVLLGRALSQGERRFVNSLSWERGRREGNSSFAQQTVMNLFTSKKVAFTLAEVLITLGIIGVVAAMTMPTVVANYQKKVLETQLKKSVSVLQNGFKKIMADEEVDNIYNTTISDASANDSGYYYWGIKGNKAAELMHLEAVPQGSKFYEMMHDSSLLYNNEGFNNCYYLPNGACVAFTEGGKTWSYGTENPFYVLIDVNCDRGPNLNSKDIFVFQFGGRAQITQDSYLDAFMENIDEFCKDLNNDSYSDEEKLLANWYSLYCGYSIMKNGWKFVY